jgi:hypothetical protein
VAISDRTRKLLWGKAASRCAICRTPLVAEPLADDDRESIVGEEAHIISGASEGPRAGAPLTGEVDDYSNLLLLCRVHHRQVDDQPSHFTPDRLRTIKRDHEQWVEEQLTPAAEVMAVVECGSLVVPLALATSGKELLGLVAGALGYEFDHTEPQDGEEAGVIADFLRDLTDWGEILNELDAGALTREGFEFSERLAELARRGLLVYAGVSTRTLKVKDDETPFPVAVVRIVRGEARQPKVKRALLADQLTAAALRLIEESMTGSVDAEEVAKEVGRSPDAEVYWAFRDVERRGDLAFDGWRGGMGVPAFVSLP